MRTVQLYDLRAEDFTKEQPRIHVTTQLASVFEVERMRPGTYIAYNRTEFVGGFKTYRSLDSLRRDLLTR